MKRRCSSDSLNALMSIFPIADDHSPRNTHVYSREFQSMLDGLDEEGSLEESSSNSEKKRRLSVEQVKALEKNFEVENKLEPERKMKLAKELGLQPRQVAVWFQNRRARWKTKQLERDYGVLKQNYDTLKLNYDSLKCDNESLSKEIKELKAKLNGDNGETNLIIKEEVIISESENRVIEQIDNPIIDTASDLKGMDCVEFTDGDDAAGLLIFPDLKDRLSDDSDSSAILNDDHGAANNYHLVMSPTSSSFRFNSHSSLNCFPISDSMVVPNITQKVFQTQLVKVEEHNYFSGDEDCNLFSDEQAPSMHWYCPDQWNQI